MNEVTQNAIVDRPSPWWNSVLIGLALAGAVPVADRSARPARTRRNAADSGR